MTDEKDKTQIKKVVEDLGLPAEEPKKKRLRGKTLARAEKRALETFLLQTGQIEPEDDYDDETEQL